MTNSTSYQTIPFDILSNICREAGPMNVISSGVYTKVSEELAEGGHLVCTFRVPLSATSKSLRRS